MHANGEIGVSHTAQASVGHIEAPETMFLQERCSDPTCYLPNIQPEPEETSVVSVTGHRAGHQE